MAPLRTWFRATQPRSFVASLVGVALGAAVAWNHAQLFDLVAFLLAAIGVVCLHAATNMSNDSIDYKRGVDDLPAHLVSPFTGGARVLPDAAVSFEAHRRVWIGFFAAAALIAWEPLLASIPLGLLVAAFLLVNEMPEHETDPRGGKRTIPARIGLEKSVTLYEVLVATALIFLVATSLLRLVPWVAVIGLVAALPLARARAVLRTHYREYPAHIAANAGTIQAVLLLGAGMTAAYVIAGSTAL